MSLSDIATVTVDATKPAISEAGFGVPLILSQNAAWVERTRSYTTLAGVAVDFAAGTPEYGMAATIFAQNPSPPKIRIGRANTNPISQQWTIGVVAVTGTKYKAYLTTASGVSSKQTATFVLAASAAWQASTAYAPGDIVTNDAGKYYVCSATTSDSKSAGAGGPTGTVNPITDNHVTWQYAGATLAAAQNDAIVYGLLYAVSQFLGNAWQQSTLYAVGDFVTNDGGKYYLCTAGGTSASSGGPTGSGAAAITDGTVTWLYQSTGTAAQPVTSVTAAVAGSVGALTLTLTVTATDLWVGVEIDDPALLNCGQTHAAPSSSGLATDLTAIANESTDWYGVLSLYNSPAYVEAVAAKVETMTKLYVPATADTACATSSDTGATDVLHVLKGDAYARTAGFFHQRASDFADGAEMGRFFPIDPGGDNWRLKTLAGVSSGWGNGAQLTSTQTGNLTDRYANFYYSLAGVDVIGGNGKVAANEYVDVIRGEDWWVAGLQTGLANLLIGANKIPFTNAGIAQVEKIIRNQNAAGVTAGLINPGSPPGIAAPIVTVPKAGDVSSADRAARKLTGVSTTWTLAGAINQIAVTAHILV